MKIALLCGGPSLERGISLNSARSLMNHLGDENVIVEPIYFDHKKRAYKISQAQLYSNTPSDFDFKLKETAKFLSNTALKNFLKRVDLVFPAMHGAFGEDGEVQRILDEYKVPYVGSPSSACKICFDKFEANEFIKKNGFYALPSAVLKINRKENQKTVEAFFKLHKIKRAVIKPATGGSSIGVFSVESPKEAMEKAKYLFSKRMDTRLVIEPFCEGIEFTVIVLQNRFDMPVAILPTEIEIDYTENQIFDFRKKYLPTRHVKYHCPPSFSNEIIEKIQVQSEQLFTVLGMRDFARFDGWLLPDGNIWFSDFNPISGMEQNSFLFQQTSRIGFSHRDLLRFVVKNACRRHGLEFPENNQKFLEKRRPVAVLFGGSTSERQVSLMSGTNAWLKLKRSKIYDPSPYFLDMNQNVWTLPYALTLNHTVEEVLENCERAKENEERLKFLEEKVHLKLMLRPGEANEKMFLPKKVSLNEFVKNAPFVFIGLHGGIGENGVLQKMLFDAGKKFNGSYAEASRLCMDKLATGKALSGLEEHGIYTAPKKAYPLAELKNFTAKRFDSLFKELQKMFEAKSIIVKPKDEGCSSGIVRLKSGKDLGVYVKLAIAGVPFIPKGSFKDQNDIIEMPLAKMKHVLFEKFIEVDSVRVKGNRLKWKRKNGWIEVTVGVLESAGKYHALSPSLTVAEGAVLSVEEKFQGGTGVNLTPPPEKIIKKTEMEKVKKSIETVAEKLGISGYARIDTFVQVDTGDIVVIEANTTPALTPSTVLFHQALAEKEPMYPLSLLETLIKNKNY